MEKIKLKLRGMANMKYFKGLNTEVLGKKLSSPICVGPFSNASDLDLLFRLAGRFPSECKATEII